MIKLHLLGDRIIAEVNGIESEKLSPRLGNKAFCAVLSATVFSGLGSKRELCDSLASLHCSEICLFGLMAGDAEDELDAALEEAGQTQIVTTSFTDVAEAFEYAYYGANAGGGDLVIINASTQDSLLPLAKQLLGE